MKTILTTLCMLLLSVGAHAAPGDGGDQPRLEVLGIPQSECPNHGGLCLSPGADSTLADAPASAVPAFSRVIARQPAERHGIGYIDDLPPWTLEINASLGRRALAGNAIFLIYDGENRKAQLTHEVTAAWQERVPAGDRLAARLTLSPEDGFRPNHTYLIRIVQLIHGKELLLSEGLVRLN